jgi:hypothetical protein
LVLVSEVSGHNGGDGVVVEQNSLHNGGQEAEKCKDKKETGQAIPSKSTSMVLQVGSPTYFTTSQ